MSSFLTIPDAMIPPADWPPAKPLAFSTKYELDPIQKLGVVATEAGDDVFVTAKTGCGKTFFAIYAIAAALRDGKRAIFTTPIKALTNQKYRELVEAFPDATVGMLTGDYKLCPDAQVIVMTAEILLNCLYKRGTATEGVGLSSMISLTDVGVVIMDEAHYIMDPDRGHVWEETLVLCPREIQLVLLSATLPSAASLAGWLANHRERRTHLLSTTYRVVPLIHGLLEPTSAAGDAGWRVRPALDKAGRWIPDGYAGWLRDKKAIVDAASQHKKAVEVRRKDGYAAPPPPSSSKVRVEDPVARLTRTVKWLQDTKQTPSLFFVFSRRECERLAGLVPGSLIDSTDAASVKHIFDFHLSRHRKTLEKSAQYHQIRDLLCRGIAFHHSGLQPLLKEMVEILFTRGFVKVLFATETFSVGLNMPTKTVVFLELEKWSDGGVRRLLRADEYIQMAGRAGRRGLDTQGLVLYEPLREPIDATDLRGLLTGALPPLQSRMRFHYNFILKHRLTGGKLNIAEQSYWASQKKAERAALTTEIEVAEKTVVSRQEALTPIEEGWIADMEILAETVAKTKKAAQKKAQQALDAYLLEHGGPALESAKLKIKLLREATENRDKLVKSAEAWDAAPLLSLAPLEQCLTEWGFLEGSGLTPLGVSATEFNEGHPILMSLLADSGRAANIPADELPCVLAAFLQEGGGSADSAPPLSAADLGKTAEKTLHWLDACSIECQMDEDAAGLFAPNGYWSLSSLWVCVASRWICGAGLSEIASEFGLFEGNVQRGLLRIANLLEEWGAVATIRTDLAMLEKLRSLKFLRDDVIVDSLYLRL